MLPVVAFLALSFSATAGAVPTPPSAVEFNSPDELTALLVADSARHFDSVNGTWVVFDGARAVVASATPKYNWAMTAAFEKDDCLSNIQAFMDLDVDEDVMLGRKPLPELPELKASFVVGCLHRYCNTPGQPGICATLSGCHFCNTRRSPYCI